MKLENLFRQWALSYFLDPATVLTALIGFVIFISKNDKQNTAYIFLDYFIAYILLKLIFFASPLLPQSWRPNWISIERLADYIFTLIEFLIFFVFFKTVLYFSSHKRILVIICYIFMSTGCAILFHDIAVFGKVRNSSVLFLFNVQAVSLLIPCIFYCLQIFKLKPTLNLLQEAAFWITTGLSFFMLSTLPFSLLLNSFSKSNSTIYFDLFDLFYCFYIILFSMIIRAYLCKPKTLK
jgi:hypothetical protein